VAKTLPDKPLIVAQSAFDSEEPLDLVYSLVDVVNGMYEAHLYDEEIAEEALSHYLLDYYIAQVTNGGHSQFLYNIAGPGASSVLQRVGGALRELDHESALSVWAKLCSALDDIPDEELEMFFNGGYIDEAGFHPLAVLEPLDNSFFPFADELAAANAQWLRGRPDLIVMEESAIPQAIETLVAQIPNLEKRRQKATDSEPTYLKAARDYCTREWLDFERMTAGSAVKVNGEQLIKWHFIAEGRLFSLIELPDGNIEYAEESR
jgi:hypothetical protein